MCGIVGAVAERNVVPVLMEGLRRLEYRGYDSAGVAVLQRRTHKHRAPPHRRQGRQPRRTRSTQQPLHAARAASRTRAGRRMAAPSEANAHPHLSGDALAVVHNGIIENHEPMRRRAHRDRGYRFQSETDTEVVAHRIHRPPRRMDTTSSRP